MIKIKRVYNEAEEDDGYRILIDRLWPRGLSKEKANIDFWYKELAPSTELRQWFHHEAEKWPEFQERYREELSKKTTEIAEFKGMIAKHHNVTLLFSSAEEKNNNAVALKKILNI